MAGLPEGAAIASRQHLRLEATAPIDVIRRGTLRAVFRREPLPLRCAGDTDKHFGGYATKIKVHHVRNRFAI